MLDSADEQTEAIKSDKIVENPRKRCYNYFVETIFSLVPWACPSQNRSLSLKNDPKGPEEIRFPGLFFYLVLWWEPGLETGFALFRRVFVRFWMFFGDPVWRKSPGQNGWTNDCFGWDDHNCIRETKHRARKCPALFHADELLLGQPLLLCAARGFLWQMLRLFWAVKINMPSRLHSSMI